jgi:hypothetical protein
VTKPQNKRRSFHWPRITRDTVLFTAGLVLFVNEAVVRHGEERIYFLMMYAGMMGLPAFFQKDERSRQKDSETEGSSEEDEPPTPPAPPPKPKQGGLFQ